MTGKPRLREVDPQSSDRLQMFSSGTTSPLDTNLAWRRVKFLISISSDISDLKSGVLMASIIGSTDDSYLGLPNGYEKVAPTLLSLIWTRQGKMRAWSFPGWFLASAANTRWHRRSLSSQGSHFRKISPCPPIGHINSPKTSESCGLRILT